MAKSVFHSLRERFENVMLYVVLLSILHSVNTYSTQMMGLWRAVIIVRHVPFIEELALCLPL